MKIRTVLMMVLVCGIGLAGCEKEKVVEAPAPPVEKSVPEQLQQASEAATEQLAAAVDAGAQKLQQASDATEQAVTEVVNDVSAAADVAEQKAAAVVDAAQQQAVEVQQQAVEVKQQLVQEGTQLLNGLVSSTQPQAVEQSDVSAAAEAVVAESAVVKEATSAVTAVSEQIAAQSPDSVVIENAKGNVTFSHGRHGELYGCTVCHGEGTPAFIQLGKDTAHTLCKNCHKEKGGPTTCNGCHKK